VAVYQATRPIKKNGSVAYAFGAVVPEDEVAQYRYDALGWVTTAAVTAPTLPPVSGDVDLSGVAALTGATFTGRVNVTENDDQALSVQTSSTTAGHHALVTQVTTDGGTNNSALNAVSANTAMSAVQVTGVEAGKGTLKVSHKNPGPGGTDDANASALSLDIVRNGKGGTAAQGLYIDASDGGTTGKLIRARNNGTDVLAVEPDGVLTQGAGSLSTPAAGYVRTAAVSGVLTTRDEYGNDTELVRQTALPADHNLLEWAYDPALAVNGSILATGGTVNFVRLRVRRRRTITNVVLYVTTAGATLTAGQSFAALYTGAGALLSATADQASAWVSTGPKIMALSAAQTVNPGDYLVACWSNGTTLPSFARAAGSAVANVGLSGSAVRFGIANTGVTTTAPANLSGMGPVSVAWWAALS